VPELLLFATEDLPRHSSTSVYLIVAAAVVVGLAVLAALYLGSRRGGGRHRAADRPSYRRDFDSYINPTPAAPVAASLDDTVLLGRTEHGRRVAWDVLDSHGGGERS
jgi:hypothetical protein